MTVALTGATGFIGSHILTELQANGHDALALVRSQDHADVGAGRCVNVAAVLFHATGETKRTRVRVLDIDSSDARRPNDGHGVGL